MILFALGFLCQWKGDKWPRWELKQDLSWGSQQAPGAQGVAGYRRAGVHLTLEGCSYM